VNCAFIFPAFLLGGLSQFWRRISGSGHQANTINFGDRIIESSLSASRKSALTTGIRHACIKRGIPQMNGKVERSHRSDGQEFYQRFSDKGDVGFDARLAERGWFYSFHRPHGARNGEAPYEALCEKL